MAGKISKHEFRSNTIPAMVTVGPVAILLLFLVVAPLVLVAIMSFCKTDEYYNVVYSFTAANYAKLISVDYLRIYAKSLLIAFMTTVICVLVGYPFAYVIARNKTKWKKFLYMLVIVPFWTNSLIRIYGWRSFLGSSGWLNNFLMMIHVVNEPVDFLYKTGTTILGMVYCFIPFMVLPLYTSLEKLDTSLLEASSDLGAKPFRTLFEVIIPLTASGIFSGCIMVFIPCLGYFFVSNILGGGNTDMIGNLIERQFKSANNWPLGAALSIILILITLLLVKLYQKLGGDMDNLGV